jgi:exodeoxyribonuclease V alpha subunit
MLHRSLVYTGITRARRLVVLVGEPEALRIAVATVQDRRRWSKLKDWLRVA